MAFENINVSSLKYALNSCKNSINNNISRDLKNSIMNSDIWHCDARNNLRNSLERLEDLYNSLTKKIDSYLTIADSIEKYQSLAAKNSQLSDDYDELNKKLYKEVEYDENYFNHETQKWEPKNPKPKKKVKDTSVESKMNSIKSDISTNETSMRSISDSIAESL